MLIFFDNHKINLLMLKLITVHGLYFLYVSHDGKGWEALE